MILRSLQVWCKDVRSHLRSTTSLPLPSVNHLCSTKLLLGAELSSRASLFSIFHFRSLLIFRLLTYSAEVQESKTQNQQLCTKPWQKCEWMTTQDRILPLWEEKPLNRSTNNGHLFRCTAVMEKKNHPHTSLAFLFLDLAVCSITGLKSTTLLSTSLINL